MIYIFADASGSILQVVNDPHLDATQPAAPVGATLNYSFDERTNTVASTGLAINLVNFSLSGTVSGTVLMSGGVQLVTNPPSLARTDLIALLGIIATLKADNPLTAAQIRQFFRFILRRLVQDF